MSPLVEIGLTDLQKSRGGVCPPPPVPPSLLLLNVFLVQWGENYMVVSRIYFECLHISKWPLRIECLKIVEIVNW